MGQIFDTEYDTIYNPGRGIMNAPRSGCSHYTFRKQGCMPVTVPKHEPIKKVYVEKVIRQIVEREEKKDEDAK